MIHRLGLLFFTVGMLVAGGRPSLACACCTHTGWRSVHVDTVNEWRRTQLDEMQFARKAALSLGEADAAIKGVPDPATEYGLQVLREKTRLVFAFTDAKGRSGKLVLTIPTTISVFEVDPRDEDKEGGLGPALYKEWKLTANAVGTGLFAAAAKGQKLTLILHGRGRGCTEANHFTAWTLMLHTGKQSLMLIGTLDSGNK
jgi:hypothetical protein